MCPRFQSFFEKVFLSSTPADYSSDRIVKKGVYLVWTAEILGAQKPLQLLYKIERKKNKVLSKKRKKRMVESYHGFNIIYVLDISLFYCECPIKKTWFTYFSEIKIVMTLT